MPVIAKTTTVAANAPYANVIAGSLYEFARQNQVVSVGVAQSATGLFDTIQSGSDVVSEEFEPAILTRYPIIPDEMYFTDVMQPGDRLAINTRNSTAGALTHRTIAQLSGI
jgi:predicted secreted protein